MFIMAFAGSAFAGAPTERVKNAADKVIDILKDPKLKGPAHEEQRRTKIMATAETVFDYREMAKRSLATFWRQRTPKEQDQFVKLFSDLLERSYINRIEGYTNEKVVYNSEKIDGDHATVDSRIITKRARRDTGQLPDDDEERAMVGVRYRHRECLPGEQLPDPVQQDNQVFVLRGPA